MQNKQTPQTKQTFTQYQKRKTAMVLNGLLVGLAAAVVTILYRILLSFMETHMFFLSANAAKTPAGLAVWIGLVVLTMLCVNAIITREPNAKGSGIPQVEAELDGHIEQTWYRVILAKLSAGALCILGGLSLGREGPSIQLGAMCAKGYARLTKKTPYEERYLLCAGAAAGLSAAFGAPLSGVMFVLEEVHKHFSVSALLSAMSASIAADFLSAMWFGTTPVLPFSLTETLPLSLYWTLILLGAITGICAAVYNKTIPFLQNLFEKRLHLSSLYRLGIAFLLSTLLALTLPDVLGSGHKMIETLTQGNLALQSAALLLFVKFLFSMVSFTSGAPGGIFFPMLVLGCNIGVLFAGLLSPLANIPEAFTQNFIVLAMAGFFTAVVRAPLTGILLICEMTGSFHAFLSVSVVVLCAYSTAELLHVPPVYDQLLERLIRQTPKPSLQAKTKKLYEFIIRKDSPFDGKTLAQIHIPAGCLIIAVRREGKEVIPSGKTVLQTGDEIVVWAQEISEDIPAYFKQNCKEPFLPS